MYCIWWFVGFVYGVIGGRGLILDYVVFATTYIVIVKALLNIKYKINQDTHKLRGVCHINIKKDYVVFATTYFLLKLCLT